MYLTSSFDENICFVSRNFPLESHKKIASFERVLLLLLLLVVDAEVAVFCVSCPRACLPLAIGFVGVLVGEKKNLMLVDSQPAIRFRCLPSRPLDLPGSFSAL